MFENIQMGPVVRNLIIYLVGIGCAGAGVLGLVDAIELSGVISGVLFLGGLLLVLVVHEYFEGPF